MKDLKRTCFVNVLCLSPPLRVFVAATKWKNVDCLWKNKILILGVRVGDRHPEIKYQYQGKGFI